MLLKRYLKNKPAFVRFSFTAKISYDTILKINIREEHHAKA
jgi:hypothetical protein